MFIQVIQLAGSIPKINRGLPIKQETASSHSSNSSYCSSITSSSMALLIEFAQPLPKQIPKVKIIDIIIYMSIKISSTRDYPCPHLHEPFQKCLKEESQTPKCEVNKSSQDAFYHQVTFIAIRNICYNSRHNHAYLSYHCCRHFGRPNLLLCLLNSLAATNKIWV